MNMIAALVISASSITAGAPTPAEIQGADAPVAHTLVVVTNRVGWPDDEK